MRHVPLVILIAAVAVLAGVTVVALGRGGEIAHFRADYSPLKLDEVTATDVVLFRPPFTLWGYNSQATDEALARIADALTERDIEITALRQEVADLQWTTPGRRRPRPQDRPDHSGPPAPAGPSVPGAAALAGPAGGESALAEPGSPEAAEALVRPPEARRAGRRKGGAAPPGGQGPGGQGPGGRGPGRQGPGGQEPGVEEPGVEESGGQADLLDGPVDADGPARPASSPRPPSSRTTSPARPGGPPFPDAPPPDASDASDALGALGALGRSGAGGAQDAPDTSSRRASSPPFADAPRPAGRPPFPDAPRPPGLDDRDRAGDVGRPMDAPPSPARSGDDAAPEAGAEPEPPLREDQYPGLRGTGGGGPAALGRTNPRFRLPRDAPAAATGPGPAGPDADDEEEDSW
jgi:hypothetical protein